MVGVGCGASGLVLWTASLYVLNTTPEAPHPPFVDGTGPVGEEGMWWVSVGSWVPRELCYVAIIWPWKGRHVGA